MSEALSRFTLKESEGVIMLEVFGYLDRNLGKALNSAVDPHLRAKKTALLLDLANCSIVNSLGIAQLIELATRVTEDFKGKLVIVNATPVMIQVFELANVTLMAVMAGNLEEAHRMLKETTPVS